jgi:hypothetical protein
VHDGEGLSVVQIARRLGVSHAGVVAALRRLGIATDGGRNGIARELNRRLVPTKNARLWQANTVRQISDSIAARAAS